MPISEAEKIWHNGALVPWQDATLHVMTHGFLYGTSMFEGVRVYDVPGKGPCIFRNREHTERLAYSCKVYHIDMPYSIEEMMEAQRETVRANKLSSAYIRVNVAAGYGELGPYASPEKSDVSIIAFPFGKYLGDDAMENGIDVCVASWRRAAPGTIPAGVKAAGNYLSSRLITMEAKSRGCAEGIGLAHDGTVSEGAGENIFLVKNGRIITPPAAASILGGITRDAVFTFANKLGIEIIEQSIPREMLYAADELFFSGTAAEVTPIRSVDSLSVTSSPNERPVTSAIQKEFFGIFDGTTQDEWGWLDPVNA